MPRLFTGIELPAAQTAELASLQGGLFGARWIEPSDFHITLAFMGDVGARLAEEADEMLARLHKPRMRLRLVGLDVFGAKKPTSIFARVASDPALCELQAAHVSLLRRLGAKIEKRRFQPHVTLARTARCEPSAIARFLGERGGYMSEPFEARRFVLYSARESVGGGPYHVERAYPLRPALEPA